MDTVIDEVEALLRGESIVLPAEVDETLNHYENEAEGEGRACNMYC
jgi:hypothetical protein